MAKRSIEIVREDNDFFRQYLADTKSSILSEQVKSLEKSDLKELMLLVFTDRSPRSDEGSFGQINFNKREWFWAIDAFDGTTSVKANPFERPVKRVLKVWQKGEQAP